MENVTGFSRRVRILGTIYRDETPPYLTNGFGNDGQTDAKSIDGFVLSLRASHARVSVKQFCSRSYRCGVKVGKDNVTRAAI